MAAVITDANTHHKKSVTDPFIMPRFAVLDPTLTTGLPPFITATTGLDALCHAVESYTNHTYNTMLENRFAKKAVRLIYNNLLKAYKDGSDLEARSNSTRAALSQRVQSAMSMRSGISSAVCMVCRTVWPCRSSFRTS